MNENTPRSDAQTAKKSNEQWREQLTPEQYAVTREGGTEPAFSGEYDNCKLDGTYRCVCCGNPLFSSDAKFESGTGWPSFYEPVVEGSVQTRPDNSHLMQRNEVICAKCHAHLGHVFDDGPAPTGRRFCMNSLALDLETQDDQPGQDR